MEKLIKYDLKDVLEEKGYIRGPFGSSLVRADLKTFGIPVYEQQHAIYNTRDFRFYIDDNKYKEMSRFAVKEDDVIVSCSGTVGYVSLIDKNDPKGIISQALLLLRSDKSKIIPKYLLYFFKSTYGRNCLLSRADGSVQVNIAKRNVIEKIPISLPSLKTQNKIVNILSKIDKKIETNNKINKNLRGYEHKDLARHKTLKACFYKSAA